MALTSGTKFGPYEILSPLGAGGMGEVYRATDTRLNRAVAIKVLAPHLSSQPELKQRLEREARTISSLNHPHICHLYDIGSQDGTDYLVMELLEGETLAERLRKGAIPLNEVLKIGIAVAEALAVAHRQGIVHRDLKPGNIMLTPSGAKLMDFGLAKPLAAAAGSSSAVPPSFTAVATMSGPSPLSPLTSAGSIVGTIQYMSPEQIEGKEADSRSDIFAFGAVLYEMAAGKRPFEGKSQISLASSILEKDPEPINNLKPSTPQAFDHVLTTCLQKNPDDRFQTAHDVKLELKWIAATPSSPALPATEPASKRSRLSGTTGLIAALALGVLAGTFLQRTPPPPPAIRTVINPPDKTTLNLTGDAAGPPVLSPDGTAIAFAAASTDGKTNLWVRAMNSLDARMLPETENAIFPFWSADSHSIGFFAENKVKTIELNGSSAQVVCETQLGRGGTWGRDGTILFSPGPSAPLMRVPASGGTPTAITKIDPALYTSHRWPDFLPDGKHFIYLAIHHDPSKASNNAVRFASLDGSEDRILFRSHSNAIYTNGFLLFARGDQLMAQAFDPVKGALSGEPRSLAKGVVDDTSTWHMDASASGEVLVFGSGGVGDVQLVWMDREGKPISTLAEKLTDLQWAAISPQGDRVAMQIDTGLNDLWVLDLARGVRTRLTFGPIANIGPVWSPDGNWIAYTARRGDQFALLRKRSDGSGAEEQLLTSARQVTAEDWSRDGKFLIYSERTPENHGEIFLLPLEGDRKPTLVVPRGVGARLSPDGHWLAYQSTESGINEIYVVALGGAQGKWQVSANGGQQPHWNRDGKELYYMDLTLNLLSVPVKDAGTALQFGAPQTLIRNWSMPQVFYDISPDGKKILLERVAQQISQSVTVVTNFTSELKK